MKVRFDEHIYKKKSKIYWHGAEYPDFDQSKSKWGMFYLTQDLSYALEYSRRDIRKDWGYLYQCHFADTMYIFNALDKLDRAKLSKWMVGVERIPKDQVEEVMDVLANEDWPNVLGNTWRERILNDLLTLGYDGFFNYESNQSPNVSPSIGVFDVNLIKIDKVYSGKEIDKLIKGLPKYRDEQKKQIKYFLSGGANPEVSLIPSDVINNPDRKTFEEYIQDKENHLQFLETEYGKNESWYIKKRVSLFREGLEREKEIKIEGYAEPKRRVNWE